jgi:serine/threonine-protein kinase
MAASDAAIDLPNPFGRYRIVKKLGQGGMGAVYLAEDTRLERRVALKVARFRPDDGPRAVERFLREAKAAASLDHPSLCTVHDFGEIDSVYYLTMAFVEGVTLADHLAAGGVRSEAEAAALTRTIALALHEAHQQGVVHRDLKPANVMLNKRGEPVVMDFGLARRVDRPDERLTRLGVVVGTPAYMAPEQIRGEEPGLACDVYSLGVMLYEMLTGRRPFDGAPESVHAQILFKARRRPRRCAPASTRGWRRRAWRRWPRSPPTASRAWPPSPTPWPRGRRPLLLHLASGPGRPRSLR